MAIFYAVEQGLVLQKDGERLIARKEGRVLKAVHFHNLEQLVLIGRISLTPAVISTLLKRGIDTVFLARTGKYLGRLAPLMGKNIELRLRQFEKLREPGFNLRLSRTIVKGKIENQRMLLRRVNRKGLGLEDIILKLKGLAQKAERETDIATLRGIEGSAARVYFEAYGQGFKERLNFNRRERRPPKDPVNSLLSLGYSLLFSHVFAMVNMVGLDPYLSCFHTVDYGKPALALDLMEEWRAVIVDALVLSVINLKVITQKDFVEEEEGLFLTIDGWRKFIGQFERKMGEKVRYPARQAKISYRNYIEEQIRLFVRDIKGEAEYRPAVFR
ncbi:MAG: CRISPR-associated endonuclease Cas1 [Candidatus Desulfofervidaceae bacterium]|nr:CRISPR-associated endonuclease Cas1 [Candidatus Desulfofervidaceae bacterium]